MEISWTDRVRNEEASHRVKEERNILHTVKRRNCLLKYIIEGKIEEGTDVAGGRRRIRKHLLDDRRKT
jgi:hypothetical protein